MKNCSSNAAALKGPIYVMGFTRVGHKSQLVVSGC